MFCDYIKKLTFRPNSSLSSEVTAPRSKVPPSVPDRRTARKDIESEKNKNEESTDESPERKIITRRQRSDSEGNHNLDTKLP